VDGYRPGVRPLAMIVLGLALVVADFRLDALDLVPDLLGWALVAYAAWQLRLVVPALLAAATGVASVAEAWLPFRYVIIDPETGEPSTDFIGETNNMSLRYEDVSGWQLAGMTLSMVLAGCTLWLLLSALAARAQAGGRAQAARHLRVARWLVVGLWTVPFVGAVAHSVVAESGRFDPVWNGNLTWTWLAAVAAFAYAGAVLLQERNLAWALPAGTVSGSRWELGRLGHGRPAVRRVTVAEADPPRRGNGSRPEVVTDRREPGE
jgi:hypothetical protein